jgi:hypothetical protein
MATYTYFTEDDFAAAYNIRLSSEVEQEGEVGNKVSTFIANVCESIVDLIEEESPVFDRTDLSAFQITTINRAAMMQARYLIENKGVNTLSGYSAYTNTVLTKTDRAGLLFDLAAKRLLRSKIISRSL